MKLDIVPAGLTFLPGPECPLTPETAEIVARTRLLAVRVPGSPNRYGAVALVFALVALPRSDSEEGAIVAHTEPVILFYG